MNHTDSILSMVKHIGSPLFGEILNFLEFPQIIQISKPYKYGHLTILPHVTRISTPLSTLNPFNLTKCCGVKHLIMPNSNELTDGALLMLPSLETLVIRAGSRVTGDVFQFMTQFKTLEVLSGNIFEVDTILTPHTVQHFGGLENLHIRSSQLRNAHFAQMQNLKILILWGQTITPEILNYLPKLELCVLNGSLIKWRSNERTRKIIKMLGKLREIRIYSVD